MYATNKLYWGPPVLRGETRHQPRDLMATGEIGPKYYLVAVNQAGDDIMKRRYHHAIL